MVSSALVPLGSALLGAVAAGIFGTLQKRWDRQSERDATLAALVVEVRAICDLMRLRGYLPYAREALAQAEADQTFVPYISADLRQDYFQVFSALVPKLGLLNHRQGAKIVEFYHVCKSVIDSCQPDGLLAQNEDWSLAIDNLRQFVILLDRGLKLGDEISQFLEALSAHSIK